MTVSADISLDTIIARLHALEPQIRALGVTRLALFGSRVRGDHRPDSDLDVLIERDLSYDENAIMRLIAQDTGLSPQMSIRKLLKRRIAERIANDVTEVF